MSSLSTRDWYTPKGQSSHARRQLSKIARGVRVKIHSANTELNEAEGTIIDGTPTNNWDCVVKIDLIDTPLSFYWQEITVL